jgi:hypothetical protein
MSGLDSSRGYYPQQYDPQQMAYAIQQQQRAHAAAMADAASNVAATQNAAQRQNEAGAVDRTSVNQLKDAMSMGGISLRVRCFPSLPGRTLMLYYLSRKKRRMLMGSAKFLLRRILEIVLLVKTFSRMTLSSSYSDW